MECVYSYSGVQDTQKHFTNPSLLDYHCKKRKCRSKVCLQGPKHWNEISIQTVHFHEVNGVSTVVRVVGCRLKLHLLAKM